MSKSILIILLLLIVTIRGYTQLRLVNIPEKNEKTGSLFLCGYIDLDDEMLWLEKKDNIGSITFRWFKNAMVDRNFGPSDLEAFSILSPKSISLLLKLENGKTMNFKTDSASVKISSQRIFVQSALSDDQIKTLIHHKVKVITLRIGLKASTLDWNLPLTNDMESEIQKAASYILSKKPDIKPNPADSIIFY